MNNNHPITKVFSWMPDAGLITGESHFMKYLLLRIANRYYGIDMDYVQDVMGIFHVEDNRINSDLIVGNIVRHGEIIPVIDVKMILENEKTIITDKSTVMLISCDVNNVGILVGIVADEICDIVKNNDSKFSIVIDRGLLSADECKCEMFEYKGNIVNILNIGENKKIKNVMQDLKNTKQGAEQQGRAQREDIDAIE